MLALLTNIIKYKVDDNIIIDVVEEDIPIFNKMAKIIQFRALWMILGKLLTPKKLNRQYYAFSLEDQKKWIVVQPGDEKDYHALDTYVHDDNMFLTLRHCVYAQR